MGGDEKGKVFLATKKQREISKNDEDDRKVLAKVFFPTSNDESNEENVKELGSRELGKLSLIDRKCDVKDVLSEIFAFPSLQNV